MLLEIPFLTFVFLQAFALLSAVVQIFKIESKFTYESASPEMSDEHKRRAVAAANEALSRSVRLRELKQQLLECPRQSSPNKKIERSQIIREIVRVSNSMLVAQGIVILCNSKTSHSSSKIRTSV